MTILMRGGMVAFALAVGMAATEAQAKCVMAGVSS